MILEGNTLGGIAALFGGAILVWFLWNLLGAVIVGAAARFLLPGKDQIGWFKTILVGFLGGFVANIVGHLAGWIPPGKNAGLIGSLIGAMGLLLLHRAWRMARRGGKPDAGVGPATKP